MERASAKFRARDFAAGGGCRVDRRPGARQDRAECWSRLIIIGLSVLVIAVDDASFLGGVRPFDGGDDGLFYDGVGRVILQKLLAGDIYGAFEGGEKVFYYGGPGLRYFRALEHVVFGESYLGYLSLVLLLPFLVSACSAASCPSAGRSR